MTPAFKIELTPEAQRMLNRWSVLPQRFAVAIGGAMDKANENAIAKIQKDHLTGEKKRTQSYPPSEHRLVVRSNRLRSSVAASESREVSPGVVQSAIGSNVVYAAIHEFGGRITRVATRRKVRHKTDARGNLVKQVGNSHLLVFAKKNAKRARETEVQVKSHEIVMPERSPFRTGLAESKPVYTQEISKAVVREYNR
jgi:phage gpG-like protein